MKSLFSPQRLPVWLLFMASCLAWRAQSQNVNVDPLTGRAQVSLPLFTVKSGDLNASVSLSYFGGSGIRVNEGEGTAGMGWNVAAGGSISREVRGLPDDLVGALSGNTGDNRNGWLHQNICRQPGNFVPVADQNLSVCTDELADWNALTNLVSYSDTEPDIFNFNAPGLSGQFVFDNNKIIRTIPYQDLKIVASRQGTDSLINQIEITTNQGVKYTFQAGDKVRRKAAKYYTTTTVNHFSTTYTLYQVPTTYYSSWYLTSISSPAGGNLTFVYGNSFQTNSPSFSQVYNSSTSKIDTVYSLTDNITAQTLSTITGSASKITFAWGGTLLQAVSLTDLVYNQSKKFNLSYNYVTGANPSVTGGNVRAFLSSVVEEVNCGVYPGYQFSYHGINANGTTTMYFNSRLKQDLFGYFNGSATSQVPEIYNNESAVDGERYRLAAASGYTLVASGGGRGVDTSKVYFGALKRLTLPSSGYTEITYQSADYYDVATNSNLPGSGIRVKKVKVYGGDPGSDVTTTYRYRSAVNPTRSSGQWVYRPMFTVFGATGVTLVPYNVAPEESILYSRTEESVMGRGKTVYEFQNAAMYGTITTDDFSAVLTRIARPDGGGTCVSAGALRTGYYTFPHAPNINYDFERGLPLRVSGYSRAGKLVSRQVYTYQRTSLPVTAISGIRYEQSNGVFQYAKYTLLSQVNKISQTESSRQYDQVSAAADSTNYVETVSTYTYNGNQLLSQVSTVNSDNTTFYTNFLYARDYATTGTDTQSQMINGLVSANRHGVLVESYTRNGTNYTGGQLTLFNNNFGNNRILPMQQLALGDPTGYAPSSVNGTGFTYSNKYFPVAYIDAYDALGHPTITRNQARMSSSVVMGYGGELPVLSIFNARNDQVVYSGFEQSNGTLTTSMSGITGSESRTGRYSYLLAPSGSLQQTSVARGAGKYYRFSCYAKGSGSATLSLQLNGGAALTIPYSTVSAWQYLEMRVDMSAISGAFSFSLATSASLYIDDLAFYPESASVAMQTYEPLEGKTSETDSRGISTFRDYDSQGRIRYLRNQDKDIVQIKDYHYKVSTTVNPVSSFDYSPALNQVYTNTPVTFSAAASCVSGVSYTWYVDGASAGTGTTLTYTFPQNKDYRVRLVATYNYGTSATEVVVHPLPVVNITLSATESGVTFDCTDATFERHLVVNFSGCYDLSNTTYTWYRAYANGAFTPLGTTTTNTMTVTLSSGADNKFYCVVNTVCRNLTTGNNDPVILSTYPFSPQTAVRTYTWVPKTGC